MLSIHYDVWHKSGAEPGFVDFRESVKAINANPVMAAEMLVVTGRKILLFVREQNRDEYGLAMSYVFLGEAGFVKSVRGFIAVYLLLYYIRIDIGMSWLKM